MRSLARPLLTLWGRYMSDMVPVHKKIHVLLKLNCRLEELLDLHKYSYRFPPEDAANFRDSMNGFLLLQSQLSQHFADHDPQLFRLTEKSHFLQHLAMEAKFVNPRLIWCFSGEDFQRKVQTLTPGQASAKMAARYRIALHMQFQRHRL